MFVKTQFKQIKEVNYNDLGALIKLFQSLDIINFPNSLTSSFINYFTVHKLTAEEIKKYPTIFLKQIAFSLFTSVFKVNE